MQSSCGDPMDWRVRPHISVRGQACESLIGCRLHKNIKKSEGMPGSFPLFSFFLSVSRFFCASNRQGKQETGRTASTIVN